MTVLITLSNAGANVGPFNLYSDANLFTTPFVTGISRSTLLSGYSAIVPDNATIIRLISTGACNTVTNMTISGITTSTTTTSTTISGTTTTTTIAPPTSTTTTTVGHVRLLGLHFGLTPGDTCGAPAVAGFVTPHDASLIAANMGLLPIGVVLFNSASLNVPFTGNNYVQYNEVTSHISTFTGAVGTSSGVTQC